ncbi:MAG: aldehyde dehydrogenase family protein [Acidimicrobiales bacterium]
MTEPALPTAPMAECLTWLDQRPSPAGEAPGRWILDPASVRPLAWVAFDRRDALDAALARARRAADGPWAQTNRRDKARALRAVADVIRANAPELATLQSLENGKTYRESMLDDLPDTADVFDYYAGWTDKLHGETNPVEGESLNYTRREPVGVCALVVPWNFPLLLAAWKIAPALAMGNAAVVKPSEFTPLSTLRLLELIDASDALPDGLLQVVVGDAGVGEALVSHPGVDKVSFTGSTAVGRRILTSVAATNLATVTLELGGNAPLVVLGDVDDLDAVVERAASVLFAQKGEKCTEPARFIVHRSQHDAFVEGMVAHAASLRPGDPFDPLTTQGPQCTEGQMTRILGLVEQAVDGGASLACGGAADPLHLETGGWYVQPTVLHGVTAENPVHDVEVFGPVAKVSAFDTDDEALALANGTSQGLAAGVYSGDLARQRFAHRLDAGQVFVNRYGRYDFAAPFGGFKASGWGKEMGLASLDAYTRRKSVWIDL